MDFVTVLKNVAEIVEGDVEWEIRKHNVSLLALKTERSHVQGMVQVQIEVFDKNVRLKRTEGVIGQDCATIS